MIVYTSGTTGGSKGVVVSQASLLFDINHGCKMFSPGVEVMSVLPFHHLFGINVSLMMMIYWKCDIFINTSRKYLAPDLKLARPVHTQLVPLHIKTFHHMVMQKAKKEGSYKKLRFAMALGLFLLRLGIDVRRKLTKPVGEVFGGRMEYLLVGGAPLDPYYEREYRAWGITLIAAYGATECSPGIALNRNHHHKEGSAGLPIHGIEVRTAPDGEIQVKGPIVMKGYYHDEAATAAVIKDGWYCTGDLGYIDRDGFLFINGRKKNLIILSDGENISPETLEEKLSALEGVKEVMVYAKGDEIAAQIYPDEDFDRQHFDEELKKLNQLLSTSHRIRHVTIRDTEFPKNTSQKIKRFEVKTDV